MWFPSVEIQKWARECLLAGDDPAEIADELGVSLDVFRQRFGRLCNLTVRQREVLSLYAAGCTLAEIDLARGLHNKTRAGANAASAITTLRQNGIPVPRRNQLTPKAAQPAVSGERVK